MKRKNTGGDLAQFYTKTDVAARLISLVDISKYKRVIEPSAGDGAFSLQIPNCEAYDIEPHHESIKKADFLGLNLWLSPILPKDTLIIGNPPFGKQSSLALQFIRSSCQYADTVAFILPLSFTKKSMRDKVPLTHHLIFQEILLPNSFIFKNKEYSIPCVFQIWRRQEKERTVEITPEIKEFSFVGKEDNPDIWFRRVGVYAGRFGTDYQYKSKQSHYFLKCKDTEKVLNILKSIVWKHNNTVGAKSISKHELITSFLDIPS
jgi:predicted RNA methylase